MTQQMPDKELLLLKLLNDEEASRRSEQKASAIYLFLSIVFGFAFFLTLIILLGSRL